MPTIHRLVYVSAATTPFTDNELNELLTVARKNNHARGVSGMLLYHGGSFIQVLEGDQAEVETIFAKIEQDPRHENASVLLKGDVEERTFEAWAMGYVPTKSKKDIPEGFHPFLKSGFRKSFDTEDAVRKALLAFKAGRWRKTA